MNKKLIFFVEKEKGGEGFKVLEILNSTKAVKLLESALLK